MKIMMRERERKIRREKGGESSIKKLSSKMRRRRKNNKLVRPSGNILARSLFDRIDIVVKENQYLPDLFNIIIKNKKKNEKTSKVHK